MRATTDRLLTPYDVYMTNASSSSARDEADDDALDALQREDALEEASRLVVGGLVGVAIGAGLGWLASRSLAARGAGVSDVTSPLRRTLRSARDRPSARGRDTIEDVTAAARRAADALEQSRVDVERHVQRGLRDLRRAVRNAARRVG